MANVTEERDPKAAGSAPIDVQTISRITDEVLKLRLNTSTHEAITAHAQAIHGALNLLVREELGADEDSIVRDQIERAYRVLASRWCPVEWCSGSWRGCAPVLSRDVRRLPVRAP
ncbi:hypothetical protein [Streptomyces sp. NBC_00102]|uniref:hypothetical protein n=1 Tax=Streptomyces sp. NBC_00102 TaxID=2975652 RepID=UPI0022536666|nr:hypothetical protein [Streptomyces sp. NBC_00102]MCX5395972.1 hypothetical protein [Streptomyces sp. NBC_00102]